MNVQKTKLDVDFTVYLSYIMLIGVWIVRVYVRIHKEISHIQAPIYQTKEAITLYSTNNNNTF